jgi:hypothetical protein
MAQTASRRSSGGRCPTAGPVRACGGEGLAVRAEGHRGHLFSERRPDLGVGGYVPLPGRAVDACGGQGLTIGADSHRAHAAARKSRRKLCDSYPVPTDVVNTSPYLAPNQEPETRTGHLTWKNSVELRD